MKAYLQKLIGTAVLGLALLLNSIPAWAGNASVHEVYITTNTASGTLTGARYSADSRQQIGCDSHIALTSANPLVLCSARDKTSKALSCSSTDPRFANAVKGMTDSSYIYFAVTGSGLCSDLVVHNSSPYLR